MRKREFKNIKVDSDTFDKVARISKALGKSKAQTVREIFESLEDVSKPMLPKQILGFKLNMKIIKNPMKDCVIFMFYPSNVYQLNGKGEKD